MKSFFRTVLAVVVGILLVQLFSLFLIFSMIGVMGALESVEDIKAHTVLTVDLTKTITDKEVNDPLSNLNFRSLKLPEQNTLYAALRAIEYAKSDDKIEGILIRADGLQMSISTAQEIRDAIADFRSSGKFVYAYGSGYGQFPYYVASVADSVFIHPMGEMMWFGLASQNFYLKDALAKWGIEPQIIRHGKYKSAVEPFMENEMSMANHEQTMTYLTSMWNYTTNAVATARQISVEELNMFAEGRVAFLPKQALEAELVDGIYYADQMDSMLLAKTGRKADEKLRTVSLHDYSQYVQQQQSLDLSAEKIALVYAMGEINDGDEDDSAIGGDAYAEIFSQLRKDSTIKAVVLRVNSPGGSAFASEVMWRELTRLREKKPLIVSMGTYAASGGYYISAPADYIVASPLTLTGSIGVFGMYMTYGKLLREKLSVYPRVVKTHSHSDMGSVMRPLDAFERELMQQSVENTYSIFLSRVAEGRKKTSEAVDSIGQGRVWSGLDAQRLGLVDELGGLDRAIAVAAERVNIADNYRLSVYPKQELSFFNGMVNSFLTSKAQLAKQIFGISDPEQEFVENIERLLKKRGIRAEMPYMIEIR